MVDADLATLYGVQTKALNQAVTRNRRRFPSDFMFRLTEGEKEELVTNCDRFEKLKHSSALPRVFNVSLA
jgi:ORF6N domain